MARFSDQERRDMYDIFIECGGRAREAVRVYSHRFPNRVSPNYKTILRVVRQFRASGSIQYEQTRQRRRTVRTFDMELDVLLYVRENASSSIRQISRFFGISKECARQILKSYNLKPFRAHVVQKLRLNDLERRLNFLARMDEIINNNPQILQQILWTDESKFTNNGILNRWNFRVWAEENPHLTYKTRDQNIISVNVWCGLLGNKLIGPYFYNENLTGERYHDFLSMILPCLLEDVPLAERRDMHFQHDGCPAHNARIVRAYLNRTFGDKWVGTHGPIKWPARSPDLTPLDYFLWGYLKDKVYGHLNPVNSLAELKERISAACQEVPGESIEAALNQNWINRAEMCIINGGDNFEQLL